MTGLRLVVLALFSLVSLFSYARGTNVRVHYVFDNAVLRSDYLGNAYVLSQVDSLVTSVISDSSIVLEIVSYSSPEGVYSYNLALSRRRAEALRSYLVGRYPKLSGRVVLNPQGESWDEFRSMVASDSRLSAQEKDRVLSIIDSSLDADVKEKQISALPVYSYLYSKYFRRLRYAEFCIAASGNGSEASNASGSDSIAYVPEGTVVHYPLRGTVVDGDYLNNSDALSTIAALLGGRDAEEVNSIEIVSTSSIEGPESVNKRYAALRGSALRDYIVNSYPALAGKISVKSAGETWEDFRKAVESDPELSDEARSEILSIIVSDAAPDVKEAKLRAMPEWDHLFKDIFPGTRYARLNATFCEKASTPVKAFTYTPEGIIVNYRERETGVEEDYMRNEAALAAIEEMLKGRDAEEVDSIEITGYTSIEGSEADNARCAEERAEALRDYIINKHPELEGKVKVKSEGEAWDDLRKAVEQDPNLSDKSRREMLSIIDSDDAADVKEAKLREKKEWERLKKYVFPGTDYARVETKFNEKPAEQDYTYTPEGIIVNYRERETGVEENYMRNEATLAAIEEMLKGRDAEEIDSIEITGYTSIEGEEADNARCAEQRAEALRDYIINKHPELEGKVKVKSEGEAWDDLRKAVEQDPNLSEKSRREILSVIDSDDAADVKEAKLRERKEWERLKKDAFPGTDYAKVKADFRKKTTIPENEISTEIEVDDTEDIKVDDGTLKLSDTTLVIKPIAEPAVEKLRKPMFAASTNVVYDLAGIVDGFRWTPNISVELPIGNKWSTYAEYAFPWWLTKENDQAWQILKWDIGARRWLSRHDDSDKMDILSGHFLGIDLGAGYYDIEPKHKGWQGEFQTVGLEYGYAFKLSQAWRLEAYVGAGWMGTHYRYYQGDSTDEHLLYQHHGKLMWFGPTKAGVSIKYIFNKPDRRAIR